jgi:chromosome segregation ATPase
MSTRPQLEWEKEHPDNLMDLELQVRSLKQQLKDEREQAQQAIQDARRQSAQANRSRAKLKQVLSPFYQALRMIFEELSDVETDSTAESSPATGPISERAYQAWKERLPPACGKIIDALLVQSLTSSQLATMCKMHYDTAVKSLGILTKNGLIQKNGNLNQLRRL